MSSNPNDLLETGRVLFQQGLIDEQRPEFYSYQGEAFTSGNPFVPWNNQYDTLLTGARLTTYFDDSTKQIKELGDRFREYARKISFLWAFLFFNKTLQLNPSNNEAQQYINTLISKLNLSPVNIVRNSYAMFKDYGLSEWVEICSGLLSNVAGPTQIDQDEAVLKKTDELLRENPNDAIALLAKGMALFNMAKKDSTLESKYRKYGETLILLNRATDLNPNLAREYRDTIKKILDAGHEMTNSLNKASDKKKYKR